MISQSTRRWKISRDVGAGMLLCGAAVLPWNLYFGVGIPGSRAWLFAALGLATLLSLGSIAATSAARLRLGLNAPYLLLVLCFAAFDVVQTVRYGGSARPPGGVGPGAWLGAAGALLAAQPVTAGTDDDLPPGWLRPARILGYASLGAAGLSVLFNLYWRVKYALPGSDDAGGFGEQHVAIITTAVVYGAVAWAAVFVASRWILQQGKPSHLAVIVLAGSTLAAGLLVWGLPIGRVIDGFHGIAQNTSTAGVGFEGYLVWAAAAAIFAVPTLRSSVAAPEIWLAAVRKALLLIIAWCFGSALMRITDLVVAVTLDLARSPYDSAAMAAFDVVTAVVAVWLRINLTNRSLPPAAIWSMCAILFGFTISRVVVGVGLAPRLTDSQRAAAPAHPVYGNGLEQQITSTFDVVLCAMALCGLAVAIVTARRPAAGKPSRRRSAPSPRIFRTEAATRRLSSTVPKIHRAEDSSKKSGRHGA